MKKKQNAKAFKIRIIVSSILLVLFIIGWIIYGLSLLRTNDKTILNKFFKNNNIVDKLDISFDKQYMNYSYDTKVFGLYRNDKLLYLYGNNKYVDISGYLESNGLTINEKEFYNKDNYKLIIEEIHKIIIEQYNYVDVERKYLENSKLYEYDYIFNTSYLIKSMSGNKVIMDTLGKMFNADNKTIIKFLNNFNDRRFEYTIYTKGKKREIVSYNIHLENLFTYYYRDGKVSGMIDDVVYYKNDKDIIIVGDDFEKKITKNNDIDINFEEYEKIEYDGLFNLIK